MTTPALAHSAHLLYGPLITSSRAAVRRRRDDDVELARRAAFKLIQATLSQSRNFKAASVLPSTQLVCTSTVPPLLETMKKISIAVERIKPKLRLREEI